MTEKELLVVGKLFSTYAGKRTGYADINDDETAAVAHTAAKSAHVWKHLLVKKKEKEEPGYVDKRILKAVFGEDEEEKVDKKSAVKDELTDRVQSIMMKKKFSPAPEYKHLPPVEEEYGAAVPHQMACWLRKRGFKVPTDLTKKQRAELRECFDMIDNYGNESIDVH